MTVCALTGFASADGCSMRSRVQWPTSAFRSQSPGCVLWMAQDKEIPCSRFFESGNSRAARVACHERSGAETMPLCAGLDGVPWGRNKRHAAGDGWMHGCVTVCEESSAGAEPAPGS